MDCASKLKLFVMECGIFGRFAMISGLKFIEAQLDYKSR